MPELPKRYDPKTVETKWYQQWIDDRDFQADPHSSKPAFSIVMPPPNITGVLTLGHVLNNAIQDILARRARMQGFEVLWLPGMDHAGIATQAAVEKWLRKNEAVTRQDLGRDEFLRRVREWQNKHGGIIIEQLKRLGCSCDWPRQRYTLDEAYARAVQTVFVDLYRKGLIYRGRRMINWDPAAQTALSDEEVINKPQKGSLYYVRYEIVEEPGRFLKVATTRPETIMADTAMAFHPADKRYVALLGKHAWRPLAREKIPIIADEAIDPEFGTGVLKVTPAHDPLDFEIGQRHSLPVVDVLHPNGKINCPAVPELDGLDRFEARKKAAKLLEDSGLLAKEESYENNVGFSDRSDVPIEPRISEQWFLRYPKTKEALAVVREHLIRFFPVHWEKVYAQWLENIRDWCISRQVWWGHRIPAWYRIKKSEVRGQESEIYVGVERPSDPDNWVQDPDTLDTWFSSWLWAYETMDTETRSKFYPTSVLVTAPDIIFFWVARMIIAGLEFKPGKSNSYADNIPFRRVYFTGLIRDKEGRKMSKSLGNSPDPLELIDRYGADGLRFGLMRIAPSGQDIRYDEKQIEEGRNFATKLWNVARFRQMHGPSDAGPAIDERALSIYSVEVLERLSETIDEIETAYRDYEFNAVAQSLYKFIWTDYCDRFVEAAKTEIFGPSEAKKQSALVVMDYVLSAVLRLLHPIMPHITEELWSLLGFGEGSIQFAPLPDKMCFSHDTGRARGTASIIYNTVERIRNIRKDSGRPASEKLRVRIHSDDPMLRSEREIVARLTNMEDVIFEKATGYSGYSGYSAAGLITIESVNVDKVAERERLDRQIAKAEEQLAATQQKLSNKSFIDRAPPEVIEEHRQREKQFNAKVTKLKTAREALS